MTDRLRFIHLSDTHLSPDPDYHSYGHNALANAQAVVHHLNNALPFKPDFVLHTGDVAYNPDREAYPQAVKVLSQLRYPVYYVRGNHDNPAAMREFLPHLPDGDGPLHYDFMQGNYHFVVLDTHSTEPPSGHIQAEQLDWLQATLDASPASRLVIALHHLPVVTNVPCMDERMIIRNHDALFEIIRPYRERISGLFFGHIHRSTTTLRDGILCSSAPAVWFQLYTWPEGDLDFRGDPSALPGFNVVTLTPSQTLITHHTVPHPGGGD